MACCPPNLLGQAELGNVVPKGVVVKLSNDMPCYQVGCDLPSLVVLVFSDVYGVDSGLDKAFCDVLQAKLGELSAVWMPDLFRGNAILGSWKLPSYLTSKLSLFSINGFSSGTRFASEGFHARAGVGIHPSWRVETIFGKKETDLAEKRGTLPIFLLLARNDDNLKVGSEPVVILAKNRKIEESDISIEFPTMVHGWVTRGDVTNEAVKEAQAKAVELTASFIQKHTKE